MVLIILKSDWGHSSSNCTDSGAWKNSKDGDDESKLKAEMHLWTDLRVRRFETWVATRDSGKSVVVHFLGKIAGNLATEVGAEHSEQFVRIRS